LFAAATPLPRGKQRIVVLEELIVKHEILRLNKKIIVIRYSMKNPVWIVTDA
jgi:hypothetical protein